jgi:Winged helix DNA-binding domain
VVQPGLARARAAAQLLHRPERLTPGELVRHLLAVQAQDPRAVRLALRARIDGLTWDEVDDDALVVTWLNRGTVHLVHRDDYPWLQALTAPTRDATSAQRLRQLGVSESDAERAVAIVAAAVHEAPRTRARLSELLDTEGQTTPHLLALAARRGVTVMDTRRRFLPAPAATAPVDRDAALAELARRYLAAHAPATDRDLAAWSGLPLRDVRGGMREVREAPAHPEPIPPRLLPAFDPYLLGWKDRSFAVPPDLSKQVHPGGGMIRSVATVDGIVVAEADDRFAAERADVQRFLSAARPAS